LAEVLESIQVPVDAGQVYIYHATGWLIPLLWFNVGNTAASGTGGYSIANVAK
jgi:hypothetical protein